MGLNAYIYRSSLGDCSANGISSTHSEVNIVNASGPFDHDDRHPACLLVRGPGRSSYGVTHVICVPAEKDEAGRWIEKRDSGACRMCGGSLVSTSDSRFFELIEKLGGARHVAAVSFHDRFERGH